MAWGSEAVWAAPSLSDHVMENVAWLLYAVIWILFSVGRESVAHIGWPESLFACQQNQSNIAC